MSDRHQIPPVSLVVARKGRRGRVEQFDSSYSLLTRLHTIGLRGLDILQVVEDGRPWPTHHLTIINLYLSTGPGLRLFRRTEPITQERSAWTALKARMGIPQVRPRKVEGSFVWELDSGYSPQTQCHSNPATSK